MHMAANGFFIFHSADSLAALSLLRSVIPDYGAILFRALADKFDCKKSFRSPLSLSNR